MLHVDLSSMMMGILNRECAVVPPSNKAAAIPDEATATAIAIWERTNLANLEDNILPTRPRATLILRKGADHLVETVALRRL